MKNRPWSIIVLAVIQILMPVFSLIFNAYFLSKVPALHYFKTFIKVQTPWEIFDFFFLFPIAGIAILMMRRWSYPFFLLVIAWTIFSNVQIWLQDYQDRSWVLLLVLVGANLLLVSYYLLPAVREVYFNDRVRWWETKPRFLLNFAAGFIAGEKNCQGIVRDLSEGGVFLTSREDMQKGDAITVQLDFLGVEVPVTGDVVYVRNIDDENGYGVKFHAKQENAEVIRHLMDALDALEVDIVRLPDTPWESFRLWFKGLLKGRGWVPEVPKGE